MKNESWHAIEECFHKARELKGEDRSRFLELSCGSDAEMRKQLEILLK